MRRPRRMGLRRLSSRRLSSRLMCTRRLGPRRLGPRLRCTWRLRPRRLGAWLGLGLLGAGAATRAPQHRNPGGDVFARGRFGVAVGEGREAKLHELVTPGRDAEVAVLGLRAIAGQVECRALEAGALAWV